MQAAAAEKQTLLHRLEATSARAPQEVALLQSDEHPQGKSQHGETTTELQALRDQVSVLRQRLEASQLQSLDDTKRFQTERSQLELKVADLSRLSEEAEQKYIGVLAKAPDGEEMTALRKHAIDLQTQLSKARVHALSVAHETAYEKDELNRRLQELTLHRSARMISPELNELRSKLENSQSSAAKRQAELQQQVANLTARCQEAMRVAELAQVQRQELQRQISDADAKLVEAVSARDQQAVQHELQMRSTSSELAILKKKLSELQDRAEQVQTAATPLQVVEPEIRPQTSPDITDHLPTLQELLTEQVTLAHKHTADVTREAMESKRVLEQLLLQIGAQKTAVDAQLRESGSQLLALSKEYTLVKEECAALKATLILLKNQLADASTSVSTAQLRVIVAETQAANCLKEKALLEADVTGTNAKLVQITSLYGNVRPELERLKTEHRDMSTEFHARLDAAEKERIQAQKKCDLIITKANSDLMLMEQQLADATAQTAMLDSKYQASLANLPDGMDLLAMRTQNVDLQTQLLRARMQNGALQQAVVDTKEAFTGQVQELKSQLAKLECEHNSRTAELTVLKQQLEEEKLKFAETESRRSSLASSERAALQERDALQLQLQELKLAAFSVEAKLAQQAAPAPEAAQSSELPELQLELTSVRNQLYSYQAQVQELTIQLAAAQREQADQAKLLLDERAACQEAIRSVEAASTAKLVDTRRKVALLQNRVSELTVAHTVSVEQVGRLSSSQAPLKVELVAVRARAEQQARQLEDLVPQLSLVRQQLAAVEEIYSKHLSAINIDKRALETQVQQLMAKGPEGLSLAMLQTQVHELSSDLSERILTGSLDKQKEQMNSAALQSRLTYLEQRSLRTEQELAAVNKHLDHATANLEVALQEKTLATAKAADLSARLADATYNAPAKALPRVDTQVLESVLAKAATDTVALEAKIKTLTSDVEVASAESPRHAPSSELSVGLPMRNRSVNATSRSNAKRPPSVQSQSLVEARVVALLKDMAELEEKLAAAASRDADLTSQLRVLNEQRGAEQSRHAAEQSELCLRLEAASAQVAHLQADLQKSQLSLAEAQARREAGDKGQVSLSNDLPARVEVKFTPADSKSSGTSPIPATSVISESKLHDLEVQRELEWQLAAARSEVATLRRAAELKESEYVAAQRLALEERKDTTMNILLEKLTKADADKHESHERSLDFYKRALAEAQNQLQQSKLEAQRRIVELDAVKVDAANKLGQLETQLREVTDRHNAALLRLVLIQVSLCIVVLIFSSFIDKIKLLFAGPVLISRINLAHVLFRVR